MLQFRSLPVPRSRNARLLMLLPFLLMLSACAVDGPGSVSTGSTAQEKVAAAGAESEYRAQVRRTSFGIAHIKADDIGSLGFGEGYAQAEDHLCTIADQIIRARGERARYFGPGPNNMHLLSDVGLRGMGVGHQAAQALRQQSDEFIRWYEGFVAGYNHYLEKTGVDQVPGWCRGADWVFPITVNDLATYHRVITLSSTAFASMFAAAQPPEQNAQAALKMQGSILKASWDSALELGASNGWALGSELSEAGRGMLIANPHYPWVGANRFWEKHLTIPGEMDVYGVSLIGSPGVAIGFNKAVGWTHTVSAGKRFTLYQLQLDPSDPTRYMYEGESRALTSQRVTVAVKQEDGSLADQAHSVWFSHFGPLVNFPNIGWSAQTVLSVRDANEANDETFAQWLAMGRAGSMSELQQVHADMQGLPWVNTIAASADGRAWYTDSASTPNLSPEAIAAWEAQRNGEGLAAKLWARRLVVLPGNSSAFEWQDDPGARDPGVVAFKNMPQLERRDYVFNANDSFWLANSSEPIEGDYSPLHGLQRTPRSLRTRNNDLTLSQRSPDQPAGDDGRFSLDEMAAALFSNRSYTAEVLRPELVAACEATPVISLDNEDFDLAQACVVLANWNSRYDNDSRGAVLFREWITQYESAHLLSAGPLFEVPFNPADPVNTPSGLADKTLALENLARAARLLEGQSHALDVSLWELQYAPSKAPDRIPVHGGHGFYEGLMNMQQSSTNRTTLEPLEIAPKVEGSRLLTQTGYPIVHGTSFVMALEFTDQGPNAKALLSYSQSGDPESVHFRDQTYRYVNKEWRPTLFAEADIAADTQRSYTVRSAVQESTQ